MVVSLRAAGGRQCAAAGSVARRARADCQRDSGHGADRDGDLVVAPQVALVEQHVGDVVVCGVGDHPPHAPDDPVHGVQGARGFPEMAARIPGRSINRDTSSGASLYVVAPRGWLSGGPAVAMGGSPVG